MTQQADGALLLQLVENYAAMAKDLGGIGTKVSAMADAVTSLEGRVGGLETTLRPIAEAREASRQWVRTAIQEGIKWAVAAFLGALAFKIFGAP